MCPGPRDSRSARLRDAPRPGGAQWAAAGAGAAVRIRAAAAQTLAALVWYATTGTTAAPATPATPRTPKTDPILSHGHGTRKDEVTCGEGGGPRRFPRRGLGAAALSEAVPQAGKARNPRAGGLRLRPSSATSPSLRTGGDPGRSAGAWACGPSFPGAWQSPSLRLRHSAAAFLAGSSAAPSAGLKEPPCALPVPCSGQPHPAAPSLLRQPRRCGDDFRGFPEHQRGVSVRNSPDPCQVQLATRRVRFSLNPWPRSVCVSGGIFQGSAGM